MAPDIRLFSPDAAPDALAPIESLGGCSKIGPATALLVMATLKGMANIAATR